MESLPSPSLMVDVVEEVLLRFPPAQPASLVRAALVCKEWRRIVAGPDFRRRFRERHRTPPMLGVLCGLTDGEGYHYATRFITTSACLPRDRNGDYCLWCASDARHDRILYRGAVFCRSLSRAAYLKVWDTVTGDSCDLPKLKLSTGDTWNAAVLCAAHGACDHLACQGGPFLVVVVVSTRDRMRVHVYSSETGSWSEQTHVFLPSTHVRQVPAALVGNALYFLLDASTSIFKYELDTKNMATVRQLPVFSVHNAALTMLQNGGLGLVKLEDSRLYLWSMEIEPEGDAAWTQIAVIQLETLLPVNVTIKYDFVGVASGVEICFVGTNEGLFSIDLKSRQAKKVSGDTDICAVVPYMSFYSPGKLCFPG